MVSDGISMKKCCKSQLVFLRLDDCTVFWIVKFIQWFSQVGVDERMLDMWLSMRKIYVRMFVGGMNVLPGSLT